MIEIDDKSLADAQHVKDVATNQNTDGSKLLVRPVRVLLVDDVASLRRLVTVVLEKVGAEVHAVEDGRQAVIKAIEKAREGFGYDVILMDIQMPELDGASAVIAIRATGYKGTIVALTGNDDDDTKRKCFDIGCDGFSAKPITPKKLIDVIRSHTG